MIINDNNIYNYILEVGNFNIHVLALNYLDILIFSQLAYLDLTKLDISKKYTLTELNKIIDKNIPNPTLAKTNSIRLLEVLVSKNRYKNIIIDNYIYILNDNTQLGCIVLLFDKYKILCFEGTDSTIGGWRENFELTYKYPTNSQHLGTKFINSNINLKDKNVIVCGHSKGGNLALTTSMNCNKIKRKKIKKIYSFDGPGISKEEINSINYKSIKNKIINIVPSMSVVGILLEQEDIKVIKSNALGIMQHNIFSWIVNDKNLIECELSDISTILKDSISDWLHDTEKKDRKNTIETIFNYLTSQNIKTLEDISNNKYKLIINLIKQLPNINLKTQKVIFNCFKILFTDINNNILEKMILK